MSLRSPQGRAARSDATSSSSKGSSDLARCAVSLHRLSLRDPTSNYEPPQGVQTADFVSDKSVERLSSSSQPGQKGRTVGLAPQADMGPPGAGALGKRKREYFINKTIVEQLDSVGAFVVPIPGSVIDSVGLEAWLDDLNTGKTNWFSDMVRTVVSEVYLDGVLTGKRGTGAGFDKDAIRRGISKWKEMAREEREALLQRIVDTFNPGTREGQENLMVAERRKQSALLLVDDPDLSELVRMIATHAKQGGTSMGLANMKHAWTDAGAGLWFHLVPKIGLDISIYVANLLDEELRVQTQLHSHFPHIIYKPEDGSALQCHHDQMVPAALLRELTEFVNEKGDQATTTEWTKQHGVQLLSHLVNEGGPTYVVGPMTPKRLQVVLRAMSENVDNVWFKNKEAYDKFWNSTSGPYFYDYNSERVLRLMTDAVREKLGLDQEEMRVVPLDLRQSDELRMVASPILVGFPVGFLHGSLKTGKHETRITVTVPLSILSRQTSTPTQDQSDCARWLRAIAMVSGQSKATPFEIDEAIQYIQERQKAFANGQAHQKPSVVIDLFLHPDLAADRRHRGLKDGWFYNLAPDPSTVDAFLSRLFPSSAFNKKDSKEEAAAGPSTGAGPSRDHGALGPTPEPDRTTVLTEFGSETSHFGSVHLSRGDPRRVKALRHMIDKAQSRELRLLNVHSVWAVLLATGWKTVENRSSRITALPATGSEGEWVLIVASKPPPTSQELDFFRKDAQEAGHEDLHSLVTGHFGKGKTERWPSQCVVGAVHFHKIYDPATARIIEVDLAWHHPPDAAWKVDAAIWFEFQPPSGNGVISLHNLSTKDPSVAEEIVRALQLELQRSGS